MTCHLISLSSPIKEPSNYWYDRLFKQIFLIEILILLCNYFLLSTFFVNKRGKKCHHLESISCEEQVISTSFHAIIDDTLFSFFVGFSLKIMDSSYGVFHPVRLFCLSFLQRINNFSLRKTKSSSYGKCSLQYISCLKSSSSL